MNDSTTIPDETGGKVRVAVVFGGPSGEHEVSCLSAASVMTHLDRRRYDVVPVRITPHGEWIVGKDDPSAPGVDVPALLRMTGADAMATDAADPADGRDPGRAPDAATRWRSTAEAVGVLLGVQVVLPVLHGPFGEDGTIQALLDTAGVAYVGSGMLSSAVGMDKDVTKRLLAAHGLRVADGVVLNGLGDTVTPEERERLGLPVFVKPARAGSSLGVTKVDDWDDLDAAVAAARQSDTKVLVEEAVRGREVDLGVLEHPDGRIEAGPPLEIRVGDGHRFFDYDAKYADAATVFDIPARLDPEATAALQEVACRVFTALNCSGLLRVDFFLRATGPDGTGEPEVVVNEVNTFPGFTTASQYPRIWQATGLGYGALLDVLIATALRRAADRG